MFDIYIKGFNRNGSIVNNEELLQSIPSNDSNGVRLISLTVKTEMGNAETASFNIEIGTKYYDAFLQMKTFIRIVYDGTTIFYGRVLTIDNGFFGTRNIKCEGALAFLADGYLKGVKEDDRKKISVKEYIDQLISQYNSQINDDNRRFITGNVPGNYSSDYLSIQQIQGKDRKYGSDSWIDIKSAFEDLRSHFGGYLRARPAGRIGDGIYIDWIDNYFRKTVNSQKFEVANNIIDISSSVEVDNIFTVIIPIGKVTVYKNTTSESTRATAHDETIYINGTYLEVPEVCNKYSVSELNTGYHTYEDYRDAITKYGRIVKTVNFDNVKSKEDLRNQALAWIKNNYQGNVIKFSVKGVDLHQIGDSRVDKILVGDRVTIVYPYGKEDGTFGKKTETYTCLAISYDLNNPENNNYTFGIPANIMTKTYGLDKQSRGTKQDSTTPQSSSSGPSNNERNWMDEVKDWLMNHKIYFSTYPGTGVKPYVEGKSGMAGPPNQQEYRHYFYSTTDSTALGDWTLWRFDRLQETFDSDYDPATYQNLLDNGDSLGYAAQSYRNAHSTGHEWKPVLQHITYPLTANQVLSSNIIEYVREEYGIDLKNGLSSKMPSSITMDNGTVITYRTDENGETAETISEIYEAGLNAKEFIIGPGGNEIVSYQDADGYWHYYTKDESGAVIETSIRDLKISTINSDTQWGALIQGKIKNEDGEWVDIGYRFGESIEKYKDGELVVARLEGDQVYIGTAEGTNVPVARNIINVSTDGVYNIAGALTVDVNPITGDPIVKIKSGGGVRVTRKPDGGGQVSEFGLFDEDNLTGGVLVDRINDNLTVTRIRGDRIVVGTKADGDDLDQTLLDALKDAGITVEDPDSGTLYARQMVALSVYTNKIEAVEGRIGTLETDYLKTVNLESSIANLAQVRVKEIIGKSDYANNMAQFNKFVGGRFETNDNYYITYTTGPDSTGSYGLKNCVAYANVTLSGNTYTLNLYKASGTKIEASDFPSNIPANLTFSRAISSFTGAWGGIEGRSGRTYTVTAQPQNQSSDPLVLADGDAVKVSSPAMAGSWDNNTYTGKIAYKVAEVTGTDIYGATGLIYQVDATPRYNAGWNAAARRMVIPTTDIGTNVTNAFKVQKPNNDGASTYTDYDYSLALGSDDFKPTGSTSKVKCIELKYSNNVVARLSINTEWNNHYTSGRNQGWSDAYAKVSVPGSSSTSGSMTVKWPSTNRNDSPNQISRVYELADYGNNDVVLRYDSSSTSTPSYINVATINHGKYTSGYNKGKSDYQVTASDISLSNATAYDSEPTQAYPNAITGLSINKSTKYFGVTVTAKGVSKNYRFSASPTLQSKSVTSNGTVRPDSGYAGLSRVSVNVSTSHNIDATTRNAGGCGTYTTTRPDGYSYEQLFSWVSSGSTSVKYLCFKVTCGGTDKYYYVDVSKYR